MKVELSQNELYVIKAAMAALKAHFEETKKNVGFILELDEATALEDKIYRVSNNF